ncbi:SUMF1/EgtB/PvdO family nonheme iron enzyme [bacterium]|nr:SUMF1/EgtB/PvdO family nonheme iron enzyme [bacterium]
MRFRVNKSVFWLGLIVVIVVVCGPLILAGPPNGFRLETAEINISYPVDVVPDNRIDGRDLIILSHGLNSCYPELESTRNDLDGSGCIDQADLELLADHFGCLVQYLRPEIASFSYYWYSAGEESWAETFAKPQLGYYASMHNINSEIQNEWKNRYGIDIDIISWDNGDAYANFQTGYEKAFNVDERRFFFLYETEIRLGPCHTLDVGTDGNRTETYDILISDFCQLAETEFHKTNYYRIKGRPVVMIWVTSCFRGDICGVIRDIRAMVYALSGSYPYIICDELAFNGWDDPSRLARISCFDGLTSYGFYNPELAKQHNYQMDDGYLRDMEQALRQWIQTVSLRTNFFTGEPIDFFLPAFPGFQVHENIYPPLIANREQFGKQLEMLGRLAAQFGIRGIFVNSFNEHYEDTAIEPTNERGYERLQTVRTTFGLPPDHVDIGHLTCEGPMVTIGDYEISQYECPNQRGRLPLDWINWYQAQTICANTGTGYRLCTAAEWEDACDGQVGPGGLTYPYGDSYRSGLCNDNRFGGSILPSGSCPDCVSEFGVYDLSGNVAEFTSDQYPGDPVRKMNKGGTWIEDQSKVTCQASWKNTPDYSFENYGFRCCHDLTADHD